LEGIAQGCSVISLATHHGIVSLAYSDLWQSVVSGSFALVTPAGDGFIPSLVTAWTTMMILVSLHLVGAFVRVIRSYHFLLETFLHQLHDDVCFPYNVHNVKDAHLNGIYSSKTHLQILKVPKSLSGGWLAILDSYSTCVRFVLSHVIYNFISTVKIGGGRLCSVRFELALTTKMLMISLGSNVSARWKLFLEEYICNRRSVYNQNKYVP
jgi:hypothetical protein